MLLDNLHLHMEELFYSQNNIEKMKLKIELISFFEKNGFLKRG